MSDQKHLKNIAVQRIFAAKEVEARGMIDKFYLQNELDSNTNLSTAEIGLMLKQTCPEGYVPSDWAMQTSLAKVPADGFPRDQLPKEFVKLWGFFDQQCFIDRTMTEFDTDQTGEIGRDELIVLMQRMAGGVSPPDRDVDFVLKTCDVGKGGWGRGGKESMVSDGQIDRDEIIPVIAVWKHILIQRVKGIDPVAEREKSKTCIIS